MIVQDFPHVRLIRNADNVGFARGSNQAAQQARGQYLFFLNNDTIVPREALSRLVAFARANPRAGLIGPRLCDASGRIQCSARARPTVAALLHRLTWLRWTGLFRSAYRRYRGRNANPNTTRPVEVLMGAALLMPRKIYRAVGGWDEHYTFGGEDIDLCVRVGRQFEVLYHPAVRVVHLGRISSRRHTGYASAHTVVGITRSLRQTGTSGLVLTMYKLAYTLDLPLRTLCLTGQYWSSKIRGQTQTAERARQDLVGIAYFVRHRLGAFWRA
jgi:GT2 family glycosyltransferase